MEERTEWRGQSESRRAREEKRNGRLDGVAETRKELAEWHRLQRKKLEHTGPAEKERVASVPQREQSASTPEPPLLKGNRTKPSVQLTRSWWGRERQGEREPHLAEGGGSEPGS